MKLEELEHTIDAAFEDAGALTPDTQGDIRDAVDAALDLLDAGTARVAEKIGDDWHVNQWLKKAVLLSFRLNAMTTISAGPGDASWWDKVPSKFDGWDSARFTVAGFRALPNATPPMPRRTTSLRPTKTASKSFQGARAIQHPRRRADLLQILGPSPKDQRGQLALLVL